MTIISGLDGGYEVSQQSCFVIDGILQRVIFYAVFEEDAYAVSQLLVSNVWILRYNSALNVRNSQP